ncbi:DUF4253 domain-containing protein [Actinophytocola sp. NPDC049390]|uniref:DUF4253 domain-containing protein n=1 Tax=Actinophytocola sp. NPDC049390 TaxID=3363894 RepID=UPI00378A85E2
MSETLPEGVPSGHHFLRGRTRLWCSDVLPENLPELWATLREQRETTGVTPFLTWPEDVYGPRDPAEVDTVDLGVVLPERFAHYRRDLLRHQAAPEPEWPYNPGPPFESWPGLAPPTPLDPDYPDPVDAAARTVAAIVRSDPHGLPDCRLVLVPAAWGTDVLAHFGWFADAPLSLFCALLRSWHERFGAEVVAAFGGEVHVAVPRPPMTQDHADVVAVEHVLTNADNVGGSVFPEYSAELVRRIRWTFWWD